MRDEVCSVYASNNPSFYPCLTVLVNRQTGQHRDTFNHLCTMESLMAMGEFTGGDLELCELGLELMYEPGAFICFRGRPFSHRVGPWIPAREGELAEGKRLSYSFYVQQAVILALQQPSTDPLHPRPTLPAVPTETFTRTLPFYFDPQTKTILPSSPPT